MQLQPIERSKAQSERRRYERYAVRCDCWLEHEAAAVYGPTADLGLGGLFLRTAIPLERGLLVDVVLSLDEGATLVRTRGIVTRIVRAQHGRRHGVGVEFVDEAEGDESLRHFLGGATKAARRRERPQS